jgi:predicted transcriptional regulator
MKLSGRINTGQLKYASRNLSVLTHPARIEIIKMLLNNGELNIKQIQEKVNLIPSETYHHLLLLKNFAIVKNTRQRKSGFYTVNIALFEKIEKISEDLSVKK